MKFIFLCLFISSSAFAQDLTYVENLIAKSKQLKLSENIQWLNLVHYKSSLWGGYKSQVAGLDFFVSPDGKNDPEKELDATIRGFFSLKSNSHTKMTVLCQFPARFIWLKEELGLDESKLPSQKCEGFEKYKDRVDGKSVSLVFSSFYLGNSSSMFGHSFIRISSGHSVGASGEHHELLDSGINYGASVESANPLLYAIGGISGFFPGTFINIPYYYKVREYNDFESRDLWSYDLNLTPKEVDLLVAHSWELGSTYMNYYYFTQNCSYHMFTLLEAAAPRLHLTDLLPYYVIPSDTVRRIDQVPGLVARVTYRPSMRVQFDYRFSHLNDQQKKALLDYIDTKKFDGLQGFNGKAKSEILDAASDYIDFKYAQKVAKDDPQISAWKQELLSARAGLGVQSEELVIPTPWDLAPNLGHGVRRLDVGYGTQSFGSNYVPFKFRFSMRDVLDGGPGYPQDAEIEMFTASGRIYTDTKAFQLDEALLFRILSLNPWNSFRKGMSYKIEIGAEKINDPNCNFCIAGILSGGPGIDLHPFGGDFLSLYLLADFQFAWSPSFISGPYRLGAGPTAGLLFRFSPDLKLQTRATYRYQLFSAYQNPLESHVEFRWTFVKDWAADIGGHFYDRFSEENLSVMHYF